MLSFIKQSKLFQIVAALFLAATIVFACAPQAFAVEVEKCTARPNNDGSAGVLGATQTRVTLEVLTEKGDDIKELAVTFPAGTAFELEDLAFTEFTGADFMTRNPLEHQAQKTGEVLTLTINEPIAEGAKVRLEVYGVVFPAEGGTMQISATCTQANGSVDALANIPAIEVIPLTIPEQIANWLDEQPLVQAWNSQKFLYLFLNPSIMVTSFPVVFQGFLQALLIVAIAFPLAIPFGLAFAFMRMSKLRILRAIGTTYVNVVRGTPLFLQIYIAFFGLPLAGITPPALVTGVVVLAMNSSAYLCEIFRAGIQSISKGQFEAAASLGMNRFQTMFFVIIPQTIRRVIPTMTSEFILLYKDTSLLAAVGVMEVIMYARTIVASTGSITPYIVAAIFYLVITLPLAKIVGNFENKLAEKDAGGGSVKKNKGFFAKLKAKKDKKATVEAREDTKAVVANESVS